MNRYVLPVLLAVLLCSTESWSQKKLLTPSDKVVKVAYLDHSALRRDYKAFKEARDKLALKIRAEKRSFDEQLANLNEQTDQLLRRDSLRGGASRKKLSSQADSKRSLLSATFRDNHQKRLRDMRTLTQDYEKKIVAAIDEVVREGGFTDVKPVAEDTGSPPGVNITQRVLQKLNE